MEYTKPKLVVNCLLTEGEPIDIEVSKSKFIYDTSALELLDNAKVTLWGGGQEIILEQMGNGRYYSPELIAENTTYTLAVASDGLANVAAETQVFAPVEAGNLKIGGITRYEESEYRRLSFTLSDTPGDDFYSFHILRKLAQKLPNEHGMFPQFICDYGYDGECEPVVPEGWYYNEETGMVFPEGEEPFDGTDYSSFLLYFMPQGAIAGEESGMEVEEYFFRDTYFEGNTVQVDVLISPYDATGSADDSLVVVLSRISESYFLYKTSLEMYHESDGLMSQPVQVYSNISGGHGFFGARSPKRISVPVSDDDEEYIGDEIYY